MRIKLDQDTYKKPTTPIEEWDRETLLREGRIALVQELAERFYSRTAAWKERHERVATQDVLEGGRIGGTDQ